MSTVAENGLPVLTAGNTVETLAGTDRDQAVETAGTPSAADMEAVAQEQTAKDATSVSDTEPTTDEDPLDDENTFDVSRAEFTELQDAFLRLSAGVTRYNQTAPHKILGL